MIVTTAQPSHRDKHSASETLLRFLAVGLGNTAFGYAVYGHTDSRASDEYNMKLSQRRAKAVADVLIDIAKS